MMQHRAGPERPPLSNLEINHGTGWNRVSPYTVAQCLIPTCHQAFQQAYHKGRGLRYKLRQHYRRYHPRELRRILRVERQRILSLYTHE